MASITMIKKDALINISVSAGFLQKLQQVLATEIAERSEEELKTFQKLNDGTTDLPEEWMENIVTLYALIQEIENKAVEQGQTFEEDLETNSPEN